MTNRSIIILAIATLVVGLLIGWKLGFQSADQDTHSSTNPPIHKSTNPQTWTCSMHPQIRQHEPGDCAICGMDLIPLEENASNDPLVLEMTPEAVKLASIQTTVIGGSGEPSSHKLRLSGKIQADERRASSQVTHIPGRIEKLYVTFTGEQVQKGQRLADLYSPEMITAQRELLEAKNMANINPDLLEAARTKMRYWKISEATIQAIEESGNVEEVFPIYADATGIVTNRRVAVGDYVSRGGVLFDLVNLNRVWALFDAYEDDLANITLGGQINFTTPALPKRDFSAGVSFIDPIINPQTRVAAIRVEVANPGGWLKPEMLVYGELENAAPNATQLTVPKSAVLWTGPRSVVYVKLPEAIVPSFQFREVELGERIGDSYTVLEGLETGEEVVTYGSFAIDAAAQLNNQASMMNKNVLLKSSEEAEQLPDYIASTSEDFKAQLVTIIEQYIAVKDALVLDDMEGASSAATSFLTVLAKVDMTLLTGDAHTFWLEQLASFRTYAQVIQSETEVIEQQREAFELLSLALIKTVKVYGVVAATYFIQHCPMAFDNQGADWLSKEDQILNPYFGDRMLRCGVVKETID